MLAHAAAYEGKVAAECAAGEASANDARAVPAVVFTDPEVAWCGLSETEARRQGRTVAVARYPWSASGRARTLGASRGLSKVIADPGTGRLLGVGHAGTGAGELIAEAVLAIEMGATVEDLALSIHPHPTLSESLAVAAEIFLGRPTDLLPRRTGHASP
jgi:dihydrolipoamide dehydrogenase